MKKPISNREEIRANNLSIPMTKAEKEAIREASQKSGLTMATWARMVLAQQAKQGG
jgi:hypothetical protein